MSTSFAPPSEYSPTFSPSLAYEVLDGLANIPYGLSGPRARLRVRREYSGDTVALVAQYSDERGEWKRFQDFRQLAFALEILDLV